MAMQLPLPTKAQLEKFAEQEHARRKAVAERLLHERAMSLEELIKYGFISEKEVN